MTLRRYITDFAEDKGLGDVLGTMLAGWPGISTREDIAKAFQRAEIADRLVWPEASHPVRVGFDFHFATNKERSTTMNEELPG